MLRIRTIVAAGALCALTAWPAAAQQTPGAEFSQVLTSRQALADLANRLEQTAESPSFSSAVRTSARAQAAQVRARMRDGDFQVGDRIMLTVQAETALTREFVVLTGRQIDLPGVGMLPMAGVLRAELTEHIRTYLSQFLHEPKVRAQSLIRLIVMDGVGKQGWLTVPVDIPLDSVLAIAGGLATLAEIDKIRIERDGEDLYSGQDLRRLISSGATVDLLSMQQGDQIVVPQGTQRNPLQRIQVITYLLTIPLTIVSLIAIFK